MYSPVFLPTAPHWQMYWQTNSHFLPPIHRAPQHSVTVLRTHQEPANHLEFHHYYGPVPLALYYPYYYYHSPFLKSTINPTPKPSQRQCHYESASVLWPEGFSLRGELRWGRLERVFGPRRELPDFVAEDLRRVYGTYPSTEINISYQGGEFVVCAQPRVGEQTYRVEKKVVRQIESPFIQNSVSELREKKKKSKRKTGK